MLVVLVIVVVNVVFKKIAIVIVKSIDDDLDVKNCVDLVIVVVVVVNKMIRVTDFLLY